MEEEYNQNYFMNNANNNSTNNSGVFDEQLGRSLLINNDSRTSSIFEQGDGMGLIYSNKRQISGGSSIFKPQNFGPQNDANDFLEKVITIPNRYEDAKQLNPFCQEFTEQLQFGQDTNYVEFFDPENKDSGYIIDFYSFQNNHLAYNPAAYQQNQPINNTASNVEPAKFSEQICAQQILANSYYNSMTQQDSLQPNGTHQFQQYQPTQTNQSLEYQIQYKHKDNIWNENLIEYPQVKRSLFKNTPDQQTLAQDKQYQLQQLKRTQHDDGSIFRESATLSRSEEGNQMTPEKEILGCNCKKSRCLKLYCECFAVQIYCNAQCNCVECKNKEEYLEEIYKARQDAINRNPDAFIPKQEQYKNDENTNKKGCSCKKTKCIKKYCECYNSGIKCTNFCKCEDCENGPKVILSGIDYDPVYISRREYIEPLRVFKTAETLQKLPEKASENTSSSKNNDENQLMRPSASKVLFPNTSNNYPIQPLSSNQRIQ